MQFFPALICFYTPFVSSVILSNRKFSIFIFSYRPHSCGFDSCQTENKKKKNSISALKLSLTFRCAKHMHIVFFFVCIFNFYTRYDKYATTTQKQKGATTTTHKQCALAKAIDDCGACVCVCVCGLIVYVA